MVLEFLSGSVIQPLAHAGNHFFRNLATPEPQRYIRPRPLPHQPETRDDRQHMELDDLAKKAPVWAAMPPREKAAILRKCIDELEFIAYEGAVAACQLKGCVNGSAGEETLGWACAIGMIRELCDSLEAADGPGKLKLEGGELPAVEPFPNTEHKNGKRVKVFPRGLYEHVVFGGMRGELWLNPEAASPPSRAKTLAENKSGGVAVVLGAGNQVASVFSDIMHLLVNENHVVLCKFHQINDCVGPYLERGLEALRDAGFLFVSYGDVGKAQKALNHPAVTKWHLTGSCATYNCLVWGKPTAPPRSAGTKPSLPPRIKAVTGELGCVTPYIVVPWDYEPEELEYAAKMLASSLTHNSSHNCLALEVLVTCKSWPQREQFLEAMRKALDDAPPRTAWYTGSKEKYNNFTKSALEHLTSSVEGSKLTWHGGSADRRLVIKRDMSDDDIDMNDPDAAEKLMGKWTADDDLFGPIEMQLPWQFASGATPEAARKMGVLDNENWCGCMTEVALDCCSEKDRVKRCAKFVEAAARFCNDELWGTLSCALVVPPGVQRNSKARASVETCVATLRYGTVCINCPTYVGFGITKLTWGAFAAGQWRKRGSDENTDYDIRSGNCWSHNTMMIDDVQKSVLRAPFRIHPHAIWLEDNRNLENTSQELVKHMGRNSIGSFYSTLVRALKG